MTGPLLAVLVYRVLVAPFRAAARPAPPVRAARAAWLAILGAAVVVERYGITHPGSGWTLTETIRRSWRTDTALGRWLFQGAWYGLTSWLPDHIHPRS